MIKKGDNVTPVTLRVQPPFAQLQQGAGNGGHQEPGSRPLSRTQKRVVWFFEEQFLRNSSMSIWLVKSCLQPPKVGKGFKHTMIKCIQTGKDKQHA